MAITDLPAVIQDRVGGLSDCLGVRLDVTRFWEDEFRPGWYCRFLGVVLKSSAFTVHVAGSLAVSLQGDPQDEVDLFLFVNGERVGRFESPYQYLHRKGGEPFRWDDLEDGYEHQKTLQAVAMTDA